MNGFMSLAPSMTMTRSSGAWAGEQCGQDARAVAVGACKMVVEGGGAAVEAFRDHAHRAAELGP